VTLASLVETEAKLDNERPLVASVYFNRYRRNMLLGADPTVIYALKLAGRWDGNIRKADLQIQSPYNTYRTPGLPPGPIANPGLASLRAAAAPAKSPYLYLDHARRAFGQRRQVPAAVLPRQTQSGRG
jgi:UPF0755 protein